MYLVYLISREYGDVIGVSEERLALMGSWALMHDLPEVETGDLSTPFKTRLREVVPEFDAARTIEMNIDQRYGEVFNGIALEDPTLLELVKLADLQEAIMFLFIEAIGKHSKTAAETITRAWYSKLEYCRGAYPSMEWDKIEGVFVECINEWS
jgi:5'-deoxynucleotidase YfbR-like HD superfamily hydrolase